VTDVASFREDGSLLVEPIAHIRTDFPTKFGVPRQGGLAPSLAGRVVFTPKYRDANALRGIEGFSHLWLLWGFSQAGRKGWSPTVRPPRLGGNARLGVFATRSPFRPNPLALTCVKLTGVETAADGPVLLVAGADLMDGTPIYDIKPYVPYADCRPEATGGFTEEVERRLLTVVIPDELLAAVPADKRAALTETLAQDPRPAYQQDGDRVYVLPFGAQEIAFTVRDGVLTVTDVRG